MLKIPDAYKDAVQVKVIETIECTCQRCGPEPNTWTPKKPAIDAQGHLQLPRLCPRCHSSRWWEKVQRPSMATWQRNNQATKRTNKKKSA
jgi:hypothetical protein